VSERKRPLQRKGQRPGLAHKSGEIKNDKFIEDLQEVQKLGKVPGGISGDLVAKLSGEQVRREKNVSLP
jgi:hypothetical protein